MGGGDPEARLAAAEVVLEERFHDQPRQRPADGDAGDRRRVAAGRARADRPPLHAGAAPGAQAARRIAAARGRRRAGAGQRRRRRLRAQARRSIPRTCSPACTRWRSPRPVKWVEDRVEFFRATTQAREAVHDVRLGADADGRIVGDDRRSTRSTSAATTRPSARPQLSSVMFTGPVQGRRRAHGAARGASPTRRRSARTAATGSPSRASCASCSSTASPAGSGVDRVELRVAEHGPARGHAVGELLGRDLRQRRLRAVPADGGGGDRLRRARAARPRAARGRAASSASASPRSSSARATRARSGWPTAARASARTRASCCARTAPAASTSTAACRRSARRARRRSRRSSPTSPASTTTRCGCMSATPAPRR